MVKKAVLLLLCILALLSCTKKSVDHAPGTAAAGKHAPDFTATDLTGKEIRLSDFAGKVVVLEFWATWCPPCRSSIPGLVALQNRYGDRNMTILAVSADEGRDLPKKLADFSREHHINYPVLLGSDEISRAYNVRSIPVVYLIDKTGRIVSRHIGAIEDSDDSLSKQIQTLL
jgi:peroxiredoxin